MTRTRSVVGCDTNKTTKNISFHRKSDNIQGVVMCCFNNNANVVFAICVAT